MQQRIPMTIAGEKALREELEKLKSVERPRITKLIAEARAHGDLKENAEYHAAREQQSFCEARIKEIAHKLTQAHIIDVNKIPCTGKIIFGATVKLQNLSDDEMVIYTIVGEDEATLKEAKISYKSPIAKALIGKEEGEVVLVKTPKGNIEFEIDEVSHMGV